MKNNTRQSPLHLPHEGECSAAACSFSPFLSFSAPFRPGETYSAPSRQKNFPISPRKTRKHWHFIGASPPAAPPSERKNHPFFSFSTPQRPVRFR
nr:MAG TPA: hypothetical protein [Caudoviricetes sp.]